MIASNLLNEFEEYLKYELNYSNYTIKNYLIHIKKYIEYLNNNNLAIDTIKKDNIIEMLKCFDSMKLKPRTISAILSSIRTYYDFLMDKHVVTSNIFKLVGNPKLDKKLPNFLSYEQMRTIFDSIPMDTELNIRNRLIIEIFYATGIRLSELVNLKLSDFTFNNRSIRVMGKGKKERIVYYGEYAEDVLNKYLDVRTFDSEYLILNNKGEKISVRGIEKLVDKIVLNAAINNNVTPHTFRHTFATHLLNNGSDIKSVQELLGHSSLNTTEVYTHVTSDYLKEVYLKAMPRE